MFVGMLWCEAIENKGVSKSGAVHGGVYMAESKDTSDFGRYLMDSGASCHVVGNKNGLMNLRKCNKQVLIGDNTSMRTTSQGSPYLETKDKITVQLDNVKLVPGIAKDIVSIGQLIQAGNKVEMRCGQMLLRNPHGNKILIKQQQQPLFYLKARKVTPGTRNHEAFQVSNKIASNNKEDCNKVKARYPSKAKRVIDINNAHELYGHVSKGPLRASLIERNYVIVGNRKNCEACAYAKAKAKGVLKTPVKPAELKGERLSLDISGPYKKTVKRSQFWILVLDDKPRKAWSFFVPKKSDIKKVAENLILLLKGAQIIVKYLRCDNAGEIMKGVRELCRDRGIQMELTTPYTPQTNGVVERKFVTIRDRAHAMMLGARLNDELQRQLWAEAVMTATKLYNAMPNLVSGPYSLDQL